jgi:hypothetical protein
MPKSEPLSVYQSTLDALRFFLKLQTQWTVSPMGDRVGLNYASVESVARISGIKLDSDLFEQVQVMEEEVLRITRRG